MNITILKTVWNEHLRTPAIYALLASGLVLSSCGGKNTSNSVIKEYEENKREFAQANPEKMEKTYSVTEDDFKDNKHQIIGDLGKETFTPKEQTNASWDSTIYSYQEQARKLCPVLNSRKEYVDQTFQNNICLRTQLLQEDKVSGLDLNLQSALFKKIILLDKIERKKDKETAREAFFETCAFMIGEMEGFKTKSYNDRTNGKGLVTVGIGFNMEKDNAKKVWELAFENDVSFKDVYKGNTKLSKDQVEKLFETDMKTSYSDNDGNFYPSYYDQLRSQVRGAGNFTMEDIPYAQQLGMMAIIFQAPGVIAGNPNTIKDVIRVWADPKSTEDEIKKAGDAVADLYETKITNQKNDPLTVNIQTRALFVRDLLTATHTDIYDIGVNNQPIDKESFIKFIDHRAANHGDKTGCTYINVVGDIPADFVPVDLKSLKNEGKKDVVLIVPREDAVIFKNSNNTVVIHQSSANFEANNAGKSSPKM